MLLDMKPIETYEALKAAVGALGWARPGSLTRRLMPCGKRSCRCMRKPPVLHGPYYQWTRRMNGRTKTMRLTAKQARLCRGWERNHRHLKSLVARIERLSLRETDRVLRTTL